MPTLIRNAAAVAIAICAAVLLLAAQRPGAFTIIGPGGGGAMFLPTVSPLDPNTVYVSCDMTGSYLTHDAGASWRMFNLRGRARFFVFDPKDPKVMYVQTVGLWRSADAGQTWSLIHPNPASITGIQMNDDHAGEQILTNTEPREQVQALAIDPADSKHLITTFGNRRTATLRISRDSGKTWTAQPGFEGRVLQLHFHNGAIYVIRPDGVSVWKAGEWRHGKPAAESPDNEFIDASFGAGIIYAITQHSILVSRDEGESWQRATPRETTARFQAIATSLNHPDVAYASFSGLQEADGRWFGVLKTNDGGRSWKPVRKEQRDPAPNIDGSWVTERFGPGWGAAPLGLGVAPNDPNLVYSTDYGRAMKSTDGGSTWTSVYSRKEGSAYTSTGLDVTTVYGVHFDPFDPKRWFITYTDIGLFRSDDAGRTWVSSTAGVPRRLVNTTYWIEFDPEVRGRMWGAMSRTHDLPRDKMWRRASPSSFEGALFRSDDGGVNWRMAGDTISGGAPTHLLLDPSSPKDKRILYAAVFGRGVYKSSDDGNTWTAKNNGIEGAEPFAWRMARTRSGVLYLVVSRRDSTTPGALYRSTDAAETWTRVALPEGVVFPNGILIDPKDEKRFYIAAWPRSTGMKGEGGGIWLTTDEGRTWKQIFSRDQHVYDVTGDPRNPNLLYASGFESSAWRSTDRGATWTRIPGYNFKWGHRVIPDPFDAKQVFITTFGGSVWHGRVDGDPKAVLDIATESMTPGGKW